MRPFILCLLAPLGCFGQAVFFSQNTVTSPTWAAHATVTFPAATGGNQTNITLAFTASDAKLKAFGTGAGTVRNTVSRLGQTVPADVIVTSDTTCATVTGYTWGIEQYDGVNGTLTGWIMVPSLTTGSAVTPTICVGNAAVTSWQGGTAGAEFDTSTKAVFHLNDASLGTGATAYDSSPSANNLTVASSNGTTVGAAVTGKIAGAISLPNNGGIFQGASATSSAVSGVGSGNTWTVSAWVKLASIAALPNLIPTAGGIHNAYPNNGFGLAWDTTGSAIAAASYNVGSDTYPSPATSSTLSVSTWYHAVATYDGTTLRIYLNGVAGTPSTVSNSRSADTELNLGGVFFSRYVNATYDEVRVDAATRSASWVSTVYANQSAPPALGVL